MHQFAPTYRDYVLYSDSNVDGNEDGGGDGSGDAKGPSKPPKTYRAKTFVPVGTVRFHQSLDLVSGQAERVKVKPHWKLPVVYSD